MASTDHGPATRPIDVAGDAMTVRRVFGEAYERGEVLIIPVAKVMGGGGTGYGEGAMGEQADALREGTGGGGGFGLRVKPVGVYEVRGDDVRWVPAIDVTRVILGAQAVAAVASLALACVLRRRRRRR